MKLFDQNTSEIAAAAASVLEGKSKVEEAIDQKDYTVGAEKTKKGYRPMVKHTEKGHTMYMAGVSYKDEKTAVAHAQAYLDAYAARGDRAADNAAADFRKKNAKNVVEVAEPEAQGEKDFKAKHTVKKVGRTGEDDDVTVDEEQDVCESCGKVHEGACSESVDEGIESPRQAQDAFKKIMATAKKMKLSGRITAVDLKKGTEHIASKFSTKDGDEPDDEFLDAIEDALNESLEEAVKNEESDKQKKYQAFFQKALKKFGVKSPQELEKDKRAEFFDYVDANYEADNETD